MAGGKQLGALVSLTQGLDMSPINSARQFNVQNKGLNEQIRAAIAGEELERERLNFAREDAMANRAMANKQFQQEQGFKQQQLEQQRLTSERERELERELATMQLQGRVDLQDLIGAQEIAQINLQSEHAMEAQAAQQAHDLEKQENLLEWEEDKFDQELNLQIDNSDRKLKLLEKKDDRESQMFLIEKEIAKYKQVLAAHEANSVESIEDIRKRRKLEYSIGYWTAKKARHEAEAVDPNSEVAKEFRELEKRLLNARIRETEAGAAGAEVETAGFEAQLKDAGFEIVRNEDGSIAEVNKVETPEEEEKVEGVFTKADLDDKANLERKVEEHGSGGIGETTGNALALEAYNGLETLGDNESEEAKGLQKKLRRVIELGKKMGDRDTVNLFGGISSNDSFIFSDSNTLSEAEQRELTKLIDELDEAGVDIG